MKKAEYLGTADRNNNRQWNNVTLNNLLERFRTDKVELSSLLTANSLFLHFPVLVRSRNECYKLFYG